MIKSCLDFLGLWWELGHPTFPNQHFRALGSSIILDRWSKDIESWSVIRIQELGLFHQKNPQFHLPLLFFFCFKELCGQHDSFSHPPAEKNPPGSEQRLRESGGALHRALAMPGVDHGRPAPPTWCRLMRENDDDTWCYNPHWIKGWIWDDWDDWDVFFFLLTVATKAIWRNKLISLGTTIGPFGVLRGAAVLVELSGGHWTDSWPRNSTGSTRMFLVICVRSWNMCHGIWVICWLILYMFVSFKVNEW